MSVLVIEKAPSSTRPAETLIQRIRRKKIVRKLLRMTTSEGRLRRAVDRFEEEAQEEFCARAGPTPNWPRGVSRLTICPHEVNNPTTVDWIAKQSLRVLVLAGTPILKESMLETAENVLNMHSSLLPLYRGTRAEFWQAHNEEGDQVGVTVHFVDPGVDTGDILRRVPQNPVLEDGPWLMRIRNQLIGLEVMPLADEEVLSGTAQRAPQERTSERTSERTYRYSDITPDTIRTVLRIVGRKPRPKGKNRRL